MKREVTNAMPNEEFEKNTDPGFVGGGGKRNNWELLEKFEVLGLGIRLGFERL